MTKDIFRLTNACLECARLANMMAKNINYRPELEEPVAYELEDMCEQASRLQQQLLELITLQFDCTKNPDSYEQ